MISKSLLTISFASLLGATAVLAQTTTPPTTTPPATTPPPATETGTPNGKSGTTRTMPARPDPHTVNENASDNAKAVQGVLKQFDARRDAMTVERRALLERLRAAATEEERKAIILELRTEQKANAEERRALGKEIREELKKVREQRKSGGGN